MLNFVPSTTETTEHARHFEAVLYLQLVVLLLSSVSPAIKYVFQHSDINPSQMVCMRVLIGFIFLFTITLMWDRSGLLSLGQEDISRLVLLGFLGVGLSYSLASWGLLYTTVTHYILIYSLIPSFTTIFSSLAGKEQPTLLKVLGIVISFIGGVMAISENFDSSTSFGFGDMLILLFTLVMSVYLVLSSRIVKRYGAMTANTVMFGSSTLLLLLMAAGRTTPSEEHFSLLNTSLVVYIGVATGSVFLLRYLSLQSLTPMTVATFHNLIPVCTILFAHLFLAEPLETHTLIGGATILAGAELVRRA